MTQTTTDVLRAYIAHRQARRMMRPHIPMLKEDNTRRGFFEPAVFETVRAHLPAELQPVVTFAYLTGWRLKSEVLPLEWRHVDWRAREVRLFAGATKNGEGRVYPFTAAPETLLKEQLVEHERIKKAEDRVVPSCSTAQERRYRAFARREQTRARRQAIRVGSSTTSGGRPCGT